MLGFISENETSSLDVFSYSKSSSIAQTAGLGHARFDHIIIHDIYGTAIAVKWLPQQAKPNTIPASKSHGKSIIHFP